MKKKILIVSALILCVLAGSILFLKINDSRLLSENITASEDIPVLYVENITRGNSYSDTDLVEDAVNAILISEIGCQIELVNYSIADHQIKVENATVGNTNLDLINTGLTSSLSDLVSNGIVIALDDLLLEYGQELLEKEGERVQGTTVDGKIYAIPANLYSAGAMGIGYNQTLAEVCGIQMGDSVTMEELTEIGRILKEKDKNLCLTTRGDGTLTSFPAFYELESFGGDLNYGIILDPLHSTTIVNAYESAEYQEYCMILKNWKDLGYIPDDTLLSGENGTEAFAGGMYFYEWSSVSPATQAVIQAKGLDFEEILLPATNVLLSTENVQEYAWGVTSSCENPEKAVEFLNLLYKDEEVTNLLQHGIEGREYEKVSDSVICYPEGVDQSNVAYGADFTIFGDTAMHYQYEPLTEDFSTEIQEFEERAQTAKVFGYTFSTEGLTSEIAAVSSVVAKYRPILETGMADDVEETLEEFNQELEDAGIDRIIEENQRQLDNWLAE
ncbi:MAG: ABC transporter substrate-binding protein [Clostridiales bacterium]|nr:ABC transporter substrate-binding protein [Clostridiales bacterium]